MGKHDSRHSKKMLRRGGKARKRRTELRKVAVATELRKQGKKTKKLLPAPPPPPPPPAKEEKPAADAPETAEA